MESLVEFPEEWEVDYEFSSEEPSLVPFATALIELAEEKFSFLSAESGLAAKPQRDVPTTESRLGQLEGALEEIRLGLAQLRAEKTPRPSALRQPQAQPSAKRDPVLKEDAALRKMDPAVVASARAAGIPEAHGRARGHLAERAQEPDRPPADPGQEACEGEPFVRVQRRASGGCRRRGGQRFRAGRFQGRTPTHQGCSEPRRRQVEKAPRSSRRHPGRRIWFAGGGRCCDGKREAERGCSPSPQTITHREPRGDLHHNRTSPSRGFSGQAYCTRRSQRLESRSEVGWSIAHACRTLQLSEVGVAGRGHLGVSHPEQSQRSQSQVQPPHSCIGPSGHRWGVVAPWERGSSGRSPSIPLVRQSPTSFSAGDAPGSPLRPQVGRGLPRTRRGHRQLPRGAEEARRQGRGRGVWGGGLLAALQTGLSGSLQR